ncbi:MAG TPA: HYR domain-containing protein [Thermoleophilaceae bacterium]
MRKISRATLGAIAALLVFAASANASIIFPDGDITKETGPSGLAVPVSYTLPTTSTEGPLIGPATCTPVPGATFVVGTTPVSCIGLVMQPCSVIVDPTCIGGFKFLSPNGTFTVTVTPGQGPALPVSDKTVETNGDNAVIFYDLPAATDPSGVEPGSVACTPGSGSTFPVGATKVTCTAKDTVGNASSAAFTVNVVKKATSSGTATPMPVAFTAGNGTVSGNYAYVPLGCPAASSVDCAGTLTLTTSSNAAKTIKAGTAKFKIAKGKSAKVKVKLTKQARKILARKKKLRVKAKATTGSLQSTRSLTLKLAKKK